MLGIIVGNEIYRDILGMAEELEMQIVYEKLGVLGPEETYKAIGAAEQVVLAYMIIDVNVFKNEGAFLRAFKKFRMARAETRVIILAANREPGDQLVTSIINTGIYDILAPALDRDGQENMDELIETLYKTLRSKPANYGDVARWIGTAELELPLGAKARGVISKESSIQEIRETIVQQKLIGTGYVVVGSVSPGAGASTITLAMASVLANMGKKVTCVELARRPAFYALEEWPENIELLGQSDHYSIWLNQLKDMNQLLDRNSGDFILADMGCIFEPDFRKASSQDYCNQVVEHPLLYHLQLAINMKGLAVLVMSPSVLKLGDFSLLTGHQQLSGILQDISLVVTGEIERSLFKELGKVFKVVYQVPGIHNPFNVSQETEESIKNVLRPLLPELEGKKTNKMIKWMSKFKKSYNSFRQNMSN